VPVQPLRHLSWHFASDRQATPEGYDTGAPSARAAHDTGAPLVARLPSMLLATSEALVTDIGLIATFGGIDLVVNVILIYVAIQIRGERRQNQEYLSSRRSTRV
jgi:hypothetical protein